MCVHDPVFLSRTSPKGGLPKFSSFRGRFQSVCPWNSLVHGVLCGVDVKDSVHHGAAVSGVGRQVLHVLHVIWVRFWHRHVDAHVWETHGQTSALGCVVLCCVHACVCVCVTHLSRRGSREGPRRRWCPAVSGWAPAGIVPWSYRRSAVTERCTSLWWTGPSPHTSLRPPDQWTAPEHSHEISDHWTQTHSINTNLFIWSVFQWKHLNILKTRYIWEQNLEDLEKNLENLISWDNTFWNKP